MNSHLEKLEQLHRMLRRDAEDSVESKLDLESCTMAIQVHPPIHTYTYTLKPLVTTPPTQSLSTLTLFSVSVAV